MPQRVMFDSVNPTAIPDGTALVAGYVDGAVSKWPAGAASRFGRVVWITVLGTNYAADVCDVESGACTPAGAVEWLRKATSPRPTIYTSRSNLAAVSKLVTAAGLHCEWWIADWTGAPHGILGAVAVQYTDPPGSGGDYDLSLVADSAWPDKPHAPVVPSPDWVPNHTQWVWVHDWVYSTHPVRYVTPELKAHAWFVLTSNPAKAMALVLRYAPASVKNAKK